MHLCRLQTEKELQDKYFSASSRHFPLASMTSTQGALFFMLIKKGSIIYVILILKDYYNIKSKNNVLSAI
jgi:hypothetical protein